MHTSIFSFWWALNRVTVASFRRDTTRCTVKMLAAVVGTSVVGLCRPVNLVPKGHLWINASGRSIFRQQREGMREKIWRRLANTDAKGTVVEAIPVETVGAGRAGVRGESTPYFLQL